MVESFLHGDNRAVNSRAITSRCRKDDAFGSSHRAILELVAPGRNRRDRERLNSAVRNCAHPEIIRGALWEMPTAREWLLNISTPRCEVAHNNEEHSEARENETTLPPLQQHHE